MQNAVERFFVETILAAIEFLLYLWKTIFYLNI